jgi:ZIP family zinc transporter
MSAWLLTGWTCVMTFGGGLVALRFDAYRAFVLAFAAGALITTALLDLIPEALGLLEEAGMPLPHQHVMFACTLGFLAFYLLEPVAHDAGEPHDLGPAPSAGLFGASGLALHSLLDGVAIGEAFRAGAGVGWVVALAVIVHKFADGVSTVSILVSTGRSTRGINAALVLVALAPLLGLALQALVALPTHMLAFVLGWFSGVFLYLGSAVLIPAAHAANHSRWVPVATLSGVMLVYLVYLASA